MRYAGRGFVASSTGVNRLNDGHGSAVKTRRGAGQPSLTNKYGVPRTGGGPRCQAFFAERKRGRESNNTLLRFVISTPDPEPARKEVSGPWSSSGYLFPFLG